ncbi:MAG: hypothetical protein AAGJ87_16850, partial [Pseudomonadota bacterium]
MADETPKDKKTKTARRPRVEKPGKGGRDADDPSPLDLARRIDDDATFKAWLEARNDRPEWAAAIAFRAGLRVFPLVLPSTPDVRRKSLTLQTFRCVLILRVFMASLENRDKSQDAFASAARAARAAATDAAADAAHAAAAAAAAHAAADAAFAAAHAVANAAFADAAAAYAAFAATNAARAAGVKDLYASVARDCVWLEGPANERTDGGALLSQPL